MSRHSHDAVLVQGQALGYPIQTFALFDDIWYCDPSGRDRFGDGHQKWAPLNGPNAAVAKAKAGDLVLLAPGEYDQAAVLSVAGVTFMGLGSLGSVKIKPSATNATAITVSANDVTLINIIAEGNGTGGGTKVNDSVARTRAYRCQFTGGAVGALLIAADDLLAEDCWFYGATSLLLFDNGASEVCRKVKLVRPHFIGGTTVQVGLASGGGVTNLELLDGIHDNAADGTAPTDYIKVDGADDSGIVSGCRFATPTNAATLLTIGAKILWVGNITEAGVSTARPA